MKPKTEDNPIIHLDRYAGATPEQRLEGEEVTRNTDLIARYVRRSEEKSERDFQLNARTAAALNNLGDGMRCQIGRLVADGGTFMRRNADGKMEEVRWQDNSMFLLCGYGSTFTAAMKMARKGGNAK